MCSCLALLLSASYNLEYWITSLLIVFNKVVPSYEEEAVGIVGWLWNNSETVHGNLGRRYVDYNNALDCLSAAHVSLLRLPYRKSCNVAISLL